MAFLHVDDFEVIVLNITEYREMMVVGEMSSLNVELIEHFMVMDPVSPNMLDDGVLQLMLEMMVMMEQFLKESLPVSLDMDIDFNFLVRHSDVQRYIII